jgi:Protein of unknown function (DUF2950)
MNLRLVSIVLLTLSRLARAATPAAASQQTFASPQEAAESFTRAARAEDTAALLSILGPQAKDLVETGDAVADKRHLDNFAHALQSGWKVVPDPVRADQFDLSIGEKDWPFPIPIVKSHERWRFDTSEGRKEILARLIGGNEITAIEICRAYVEAQREYASEKRDGLELRQYAPRIVSTPGKKDGLYWPVASGEPQSPAGEILARMSAEGYTEEKGKPKIFRGYRFRVLKSQGPYAPGGARDYVVRGYMIGGFALVAFPVDYGVTGITTFIVNQDGIVYEKDLGPKTVAIATGMKAYDPDKSWRKAP